MTDLYKAMVKPNQTIREAMKKINDSTIGFVMVVDEDLKLLGVASDGDIRRSILDGAELSAPISGVMNKSPITIKDSSRATKEAKRLITSKQLQAVPILNEYGIVIRLVGKREIEPQSSTKLYDNPVVIMAGGRGSRLGELTDNCPKPLISIDGMPLIERVIRNFSKQGFTNIFVSTNYKSEMIKSHLKDGDHLEVRVRYLDETTPLGTAGALHLLPQLDSELPLIVINGDILTTVKFGDILDYHNLGDYDGTMCVRSHDFQIPFGVVNVNDNKIQELNEKPSFTQLINAGVYVLRPKLLSKIPEQKFYNMTTLFQDCIESGHNLGAYVINDYWIDIGSKDDLNRAQADIKKLN